MNQKGNQMKTKKGRITSADLKAARLAITKMAAPTPSKPEPAVLHSGYPALVFDYLVALSWTRNMKSFAELTAYFAALSNQLHASVGYQWSNQHIYVANIYGEMVLKLMASHDHLSLWSAASGSRGRALPPILKWEELLTKMEEYITRITDGEFYCDSCRAWKPAGHFKPYSFAGFVCSKCFDPKRHLPPDTSG